MPDRSEWVTVFERFPSGRIPIIGPIGLMVHDWSKPVDGHPRLFDHSALELLTTAHPRVVVSVYSLLAVALLWSGVDAGLSASVVVRRAAAGIAVWTLTEYLMRFSAASLSGISPTISFTTASTATTRRAAC